MSANPTQEESIHPQSFTIDPKQEMANFCYNFVLANATLLRNLIRQDQLFSKTQGVYHSYNTQAVIAITQLQHQLGLKIIHFDHGFFTHTPISATTEVNRLIAETEQYLAIFTVT